MSVPPNSSSSSSSSRNGSPILLVFATPGSPEFVPAQKFVEVLRARSKLHADSAHRPVGLVRFISRLSSVLIDLELLVRHEVRETFVGIYLSTSPTPERWVSLPELAAAFSVRYE